MLQLLIVLRIFPTSKAAEKTEEKDMGTNHFRPGGIPVLGVFF